MSCQWRAAKPAADAHTPQYFHTLDLFLSFSPALSPPTERGFGQDDEFLQDATRTALGELVRACCAYQPSLGEVEAVLKVILVPSDGVLVSSDILGMRMRDCEFVASVIPLSIPNSYFPATSNWEKSLLAMLRSSPGALLIKETSTPLLETLELLERDLQLRLSFNWMLPAKPAARRVAVVGGRPPLDMKRGSYACQGPFDAARALGISITVLDHPGHWLQDDRYAHLRNEFVPIDMTSDEELPRRIVDAIEGRYFDGVVTFSDAYVIATAQAAEMLSLPTESVKAILQAHHKQKTRQVLGCPGVQVLWLNSEEQLDDPVTAAKLQTLQYPLVVKPSQGGGSTGVKKANDYPTMLQAVRQLRESGLGEHGILLETYVSGPEVDANFVLWDGELLFAEISDDFPCRADADESSLDDDFAETFMILPSQLVTDELDMIRSSLYQNLLQLGFRSGIFHVEARVVNSARCYQKTDGLLDLADAEPRAVDAKPSVFLIEVNARQPGLDCVFSTLYTYGVDFNALRLLHAIGDQERFAALAQPFQHGLPQYHCGNCQIPVHRENIVVPEDFFEILLARIPDIAPHVSRAELLSQPGNTVSPRGGSWFIGYLLVHSRISRRHVLEMCDRIQGVARLVLDGV